MIIAKTKPFENIRAMLEGSQNVLVLGCGTCVAVCLSGGDKEVGILASSLRMADKVSGKDRVFSEHTVERQCEWEFIDEIQEKVKKNDTILSLGCGVGVQALSERFPEIRVLPGLDTVCMGMPEKEGVWVERCSGCGNCLLDKTAGICPITRCAKSLLNGPCGGSVGGKCEISPDTPCAWQLIIERLTAWGKLEMLDEVQPPRDWSTSHAGGPRKVTSKDQYGGHA
jgi:ferredoxin